MKKYIKSIMAMLLALASQQLLAANTVTTVNQVTEAVTVSADVDYTITNATPFTTTGSIDITNTEHAVVIIKNIKPSVVKSKWLASYVKINGEKAVDGSNCQVKMYGYGAIILPYASNIKPLTVYSEKNFEGTAVNDFGLEHTGGFMNTLTTEKLNNQIRSFKLKRGYMVTFSTRAGGRGYSRCFIADKADLEISSLPLLLDQKISSYRVFHWYNAKKAGIADSNDKTAINLLNASWCYRMWPDPQGLDYQPDCEYVPHHYKENYPVASALGNQSFSCHMKGNNEPGNSADEAQCSVDEVLANWEDHMRTGLRLLSESSHDGSMGHLKAFMDSIDARGWRCDILDLHCYWPSGSFNNLNWYSSEYGKGRPIWISEWVWGASWNHNGFWSAVSDPGSLSASNQQTLYNGTKPILDVLNSNSKVERYAYWNSEAAGSRIYDSGKLTKLGEYYANMGEGLGYNPANEYIPTLPPMKNTSTLKVEYDKDTKTAVLKWRDYNGEYNQSMVIQQQALGSTAWTDFKTVTQKEQEATYTETISDCNDGTKFRIVIKVPSSNTGTNTKTLTGNTVTARNATLEYGDPVTVIINDEPVQKYLGGNKVINGDFSLGKTDWKAGDGNTICAPYFQLMPEGGVGNSPYLQAYGNKVSTTSEQSILYNVNIERDKAYYVAACGINTKPAFQYFRTTGSASAIVMKLEASTTWGLISTTFLNTTGDKLGIYLTNCAGVSQFDDLMVCQLFDTPEEALADALTWEKKRAAAFLEYNTILPVLNTRISEAIAAAASANELEATLQQALDIITSYKQLGNTLQDANTIIALDLTGADDIKTAVSKYEAAVATESTLSIENIQNAITVLKDNTESVLSYTLNTKAIQNPSFAATTGWTTKAGTYTGGDQRINEWAGKKCWNAWWAVATAANPESQTMAIKQTVSNLEEGLYSLECKGSTQHYCETDQHAFLTYNGTDYNSPVLDLGNGDIPSFSNSQMWRTMTTPYVYIKAGGNATIGFMSSKQGAVDKTYIKYGDATNTGDNREGWWLATDFQLRYVPAISRQQKKGTWGTICMPYKITIPKGVTLYTIAGRSNDGMHIFMQPVTDESKIVAGRGYVYYATEENVMFTGSGDPVTKSTIYLGLTGVFNNTTTKYGVFSAALVDGKWIYKPGTTVVPSNTAYISIFSTITNKYDVAPEGTISMPLVGYVQDVLGDANDDGEVTMADALAIQAYFVGTEGVTINTTKADYNGDGKITIDDANCIINAVVK